MHTVTMYRAFGMTIETCLPLPMLATCAPDNAADLVIAADDIPPCLPGGIQVKQHACINDHQAWLDFTEAGRFWVNNGQEIRTPSFSANNNQDWYFHLLGPAFMCALAQRGTLPLHACAIVVNGKAALVMGQSGTGKSTLAIGMDTLGIPVLSDDMCAVHRNPDGMLTVSPAYPYAKLQSPPHWLAPLSPLWHHSSNRRHKNYFALKTPAPGVALPLSALYVLEQGNATTIEPLSREQAESVLHANTQRRALFQAIRGVQVHRQWCSMLANHIPAFRFSRRHDSAAFFNDLQQLIQHTNTLTGH